MHAWQLHRSPYAWLTEGPLHRDVEIAELWPTLSERNVAGIVLVQSDDTAEDTAHLLEVAAVDPRVLGVVAFSPLDRPARLAADLERFSGSAVVGIRNLVHERPPQWLSQPSVDESLGTLADAGLPWDFPTADAAGLACLPAILRRHPRLRVVIDHLGKPPIGGSEAQRQRWRELFAECARHPGVVAKLSGLYGGAGDLENWSIDLIRPFVADALALLGPGRLLYGGDWPIVDLAGGYGRAWEALRTLIGELAPLDESRIFEVNARVVYGLAEPQVTRSATTVF